MGKHDLEPKAAMSRKASAGGLYYGDLDVRKLGVGCSTVSTNLTKFEILLNTNDKPEPPDPCLVMGTL